MILVESHNGAARRHYVGKSTRKKILRAGLWWPTLHKDVIQHSRACDTFQRKGGPLRRDEITLVPRLHYNILASGL